MSHTLLFVSLLVFVGFLVIPLSKKLGAPILLIVLIAGMLVGEDGPGQVYFDDFNLAYLVGSFALAVILFAGGLETSFSKVRKILPASFIFSTLSVCVTAFIVGIAATFILDVSLEYGLLLGAVVGSTDAAATFLLIQQGNIRLRERLKNTLILESGINDPMAIFLTITFTTLIGSGKSISFASLADLFPLLLQQLGLGLLIGLAGGWLLLKTLKLIKLPDGIYPPMALSGALAIFFATDLLGGSGFLAIYLCGFLLSSFKAHSLERIRNFSEGLQWLSQISLFLLLGLLVTPSDLLDSFIPALAIAFILMLIARPVAISLFSLPLGYTLKETTYLSWVGLRGAVPIYLAIFPIITPGPVQVELFNIVFVIVVTSLIIQGWTISPAARWLGLIEKDTP